MKETDKREYKMIVMLNYSSYDDKEATLKSYNKRAQIFEDAITTFINHLAIEKIKVDIKET